jgi:glycosyltransferase 2 family protein
MLEETTELKEEDLPGEGRLIQRVYQFALRAKKSHGLWRWCGYLLTLAALVYILVLLLYGGQQLRDIEWSAYLPVALVSLLVYLVSLLLQLSVWLRLISFHRQMDWRDVEIYSRMILLRSLPGGIWHWVGRAAMYKAATPISGRTVVKASSVEWVLFFLAGLGIFAASNLSQPLWGLIALVIFALAAGIAARWQPSSRALGLRVAEGALWILLDVFSWWLGALILFLFVEASGVRHVSLVEMARVTTLAGDIAILAALFPTGFGIREISLTVLLQPYMPSALGLLVALLVRLLYVLADTSWGLIGWGLSRLAQRISVSSVLPMAEKKCDIAEVLVAKERQ